MRKPDYMVTMPRYATQDQWESLQAAATRYAADPSQENHRIITALGGAITSAPRKPVPPRPALVRRAMALHR